MFICTPTLLSTHPVPPIQTLTSKASFILCRPPGILVEPVEEAPELVPHLAVQRCELAMLLSSQIFGCSKLTFEVRYLHRIKEDAQSRDFNALKASSTRQIHLSIPSSVPELVMTGISRTPSYDVEEYTEEELKYVDLIDPPTGTSNTMQTSTPNSSPSKRRITLTGGAVGSIRHVANEREEANRREEANTITPQPASDEEGLPPRNPLVPPIATLSHAAPTVDATAATSRRSESLGPFGYVPHGSGHGGQLGAVYPPSSTSPAPFGYPSIGNAAHPAQNTAQVYPPYHPAYSNHPSAAYGFHYPYGAHPNSSAAPPPSLASASSHSPQPPPPLSTSPSLPPQPPQPTVTSSSLPPQLHSASLLQPPPPQPAAGASPKGDPNVAPPNKIVAETSAEAPAVADKPTSSSKEEDIDNVSDDESLSGDELLGPESLPPSPSKANGRPSQEKIAAADDLCRKIANYIVKKCADGNLETFLVYDRLCGRVLKSKGNLHEWNEYQSYVVAEQNKVKELGRLDGTKLAWDGVSNPTPEQIAKAWQLFKAEHGDEVKSMMEMWAMVKEIVTSQTQGERKRDFVSVQNQLINLINWVYNRYNIHIWAVLAGGLSRSDQSFSLLCELNMCKGFSQVLGVAPEVIGPLFQSYLYYQNALKVSNQQFAAMGAMRGLKVTGPGVDEGPPVSSLPTSVLPPPSATSTPKKQKPNVLKDDVRVVVKARIDECLTALGRSFTRKTLPWSTLAHECIEVGVQVINYPRGTLYPWEEQQTERSAKAAKTTAKKPSNRGIKNLPPADQARLVDACREDRDDRLSLVSADSILLENGDLPVFVSAPDTAGNVTKTFAKDIPGCLDSIKAIRNTRERKVKFEEVETDVPASSTSETRASHARAAKNKAKPTYGMPSDSEEGLSELTDEDTPRVKKKGTAKKIKTPAIVPETPSPDRAKAVPAKSIQQAPSKGNVRARLQVDKPSSTLPKTPPKAISAAEFTQGGFEAVDFGILKRGPEATAEEGPVSKKLKPTETTEVPKPPSTSRVQPKWVAPSEQLPSAPPHLPHPQARSGDGPPTSATHTAATPPPLLPPPFQWQGQAPSSSNAPYPMPYHPAMYGVPPAHPHAPPPAHQPPTTMHPAHPQPGASAPAPANLPPEMMAAMQTLQAYMQAGPWGYQPAPAGPGRQ
ncbi:hypothetical protein PQX77_007658 [Marasmius sp. AFHP31]|nr:hypothetical protein PQX77_007658 [Marasmius sp. AFHP31]